MIKGRVDIRWQLKIQEEMKKGVMCTKFFQSKRTTNG